MEAIVVSTAFSAVVFGQREGVRDGGREEDSILVKATGIEDGAVGDFQLQTAGKAQSSHFSFLISHRRTENFCVVRAGYVPYSVEVELNFRQIS
jgi:hypothetical protein